MGDRHELRDDAIERMEGRVRREIRHRNSAREGLWWLPRTPRRAAVALAVLVVVSMGVGGAVVAAAYEARQTEQRQLLAAVYEQRVTLAAQRLELVKTTLAAAQIRVDVGLASPAEARQASARLAEAEVALNRSHVDLEEVRLSGREPRDEISAPVVSGRDFVGKRLEMAIGAALARLDVETRLLEDTRLRVDVGAADPMEVDLVRARIVETEAAIESLQRRIRVRQQFVKGAMDARRADLQALEVEAEMRHRTIPPKIDLAIRQVDRLRSRVETGQSQQVELAEATLRLRALEVELAKADLDLATIRRQLQQR